MSNRSDKELTPRDFGGHAGQGEDACPPSYARVWAVHAPWAVISGLPLLWTVLLPRLPVPFRSCTVAASCGVPCPFCGVTRSFRMMASGAWVDALRFCPLGVLVFTAVVLFFLWNLAALLSGRLLIPRRLFSLATRHRRMLLTALALLVVLNWGYRILHGLC